MSTADITITAMAPADWGAVAAIHQEGIDTGQATFEVAPAGSWDEWQKSKIKECSLVARRGGEVIGWAALSPVSRRVCYAGVAENSVYVAVRARGGNGYGGGSTSKRRCESSSWRRRRMLRLPVWRWRTG